jgi:hypothetical protein
MHHAFGTPNNIGLGLASVDKTFTECSSRVCIFVLSSTRRQPQISRTAHSRYWASGVIALHLHCSLRHTSDCLAGNRGPCLWISLVVAAGPGASTDCRAMQSASVPGVAVQHLGRTWDTQLSFKENRKLASGTGICITADSSVLRRSSLKQCSAGLPEPSSCTACSARSKH